MADARLSFLSDDELDTIIRYDMQPNEAAEAVRTWYEQRMSKWKKLVPFEKVCEKDGKPLGAVRISGGRLALVPITRYEYDLSVERGADIIEE